MQRSIGIAAEGVLDFLNKIPMSGSTVKYYRSCYRTINSYCQSKGIKSFTDKEATDFSLFQMSRHERGEIGLIYALTLRKAAMMLADCTEGKMLVWERRNYSPKSFCTEYSRILSEFEESIIRTLSLGSVKNILIMTRQFLEYLENADVHEVSKLTLNDVRRFIIITSPKHKGNMLNLTWPIKKFILFLGEAGYTSIDVQKLIITSSPRRIKSLPCFTESETDALFTAVDTSTQLGKRDYAIMKVALGTGLRGEDVCGLRLKDIDWIKYEISVSQSKTGVHINLPLLPDIGNAVADYILNARPKTDCDYIFVRHRKPHTWLGDGPTGALIMKRYQGDAGLMHVAGDGKTFHAFRRTVGARLVKAEIPLPSVAQQLGHKSIESTKRYISLNDDTLRVCCMDISDYATGKGGLV